MNLLDVVQLVPHADVMRAPTPPPNLEDLAQLRARLRDHAYAYADARVRAQREHDAGEELRALDADAQVRATWVQLDAAFETVIRLVWEASCPRG